jgi:hypothetical protein
MTLKIREIKHINKCNYEEDDDVKATEKTEMGFSEVLAARSRLKWK